MIKPIEQTRRYRIDHGLCPVCGEEAAPYYFCPKHRELRAMDRLLTQMAGRQIIKKEGRGQNAVYSIPYGFNGRSIEDFRWGKTIFEMDPDDKRLRPRMGRMPVDLGDTLVEIFRSEGRWLTIEEIRMAWVRLRSKRKTESLAGDMTAIIAAQRRRELRNAKRLAALGKKLTDDQPERSDNMP